MENVQEMHVIPGYHPITIRLIHLLETGEIGDILTDAQLEEEAGVAVGVGERGYAYLGSAIRYCIGSGKVWQRVRGEHLIKCLDVDEIFSSAEVDLKGIKRKANRGTRKIFSIDPKDIDLAKMTKYSTLSAQMATVAMFASKKTTTKMLENSVKEPLKLEETLKIFK